MGDKDKAIKRKINTTMGVFFIKIDVFFGTNWYTLSAELSLFCFESQDKTSPESLLR